MIGLIVSHYKIVKKLGSGGMGEVYLAEDANLSRLVAIKFLAIHLAANPEFRSRFKHEAQAAGSLNHPNIITIHEVSEFEGRPYIVMEYVDGESLSDLIARQELQLSRVIGIAIQICEGLRKAHQKGIWHRDIKPANILLDSEGRVKIVDFGLAKLRGATRLTTDGTFLGTLPYMSPEQVRGEKLDQRSDIFSLGATLYEMITRRLPFQGETETWEAISYAIFHQEPEPLARYKRGVSERLQSIVDKTLDKNRDTRCPNIESLLVDLRREQDFLTKLLPPTATVPPSARTRPQKVFSHRYRWPALAVGGVMLLIIAAKFLLPSFFALSSLPGDKNLNAPGNTSFTEAKKNVNDSIEARQPKPSFVRVIIAVDPLDAQVMIDGKTLAPTQLDNLNLTIGIHKIRISKPGYKTREGQVNLAPGDTTLAYKLEKLVPKTLDSVRDDTSKMTQVEVVQQSLLGTVRILVLPYGDIYIDDKLEFQEAESFQEKTLTVGRHLIKVVHPELGQRQREIIVERDTTLSITFDFKNE